MGYAFTKNADGSLTIKDYALMAPMKKGEKGTSADIDASWFESAITNQRALKQGQGERVFLFEGHHEVDQKTGEVKRYAPVVGHAEPSDLYFDGKLLRAREARVTDPRAVKLFEQGQVGNTSSEFFEKSRRFVGVALLGPLPGHQDKDLPPSRLEGLTVEQIAELSTLAKSESLSTNTITEQVAMTPDEIKKLVQDTITEALKTALPEAIKTLRTEDGDPFADNVNDRIKKLVEEARAGDKRVNLIERCTMSMIGLKGSLWNEPALREHFTSFKTEEGISAEFKRLRAMATKAEADAAMTESETLQGPDFKLRKEAEAAWNRDPEGWKNQKYTRESFIKNYMEDLSLSA